MRIIVPEATRFSEMVAFSRELDGVVDEPEYEFDFGHVKFVTPAWLIIVGSALRKFRTIRPNARRRADKFQHLRYAAHVGFFKYFGVQFGLEPAEASGSETYIPHH